MKAIYIILVSLLTALSVASAYTPEQQTAIDGTRLSFQLGQAYEKVLQGGEPSAFNALVDQWNSWVTANFGQDPNLLMQKKTGPLDLTKPIVIRNNTTSGMVHAIDGNSWANRTITTNDANLLSQAELEANRKANKGMGEGYLPAP
ncbi:MAG: hypothetical protein ACYDHX_04050 [Methanothrix sp.]